MAVVGHGLVGLAMGGWVSSSARNHRLFYVWPGIMVLLAYVVDLGEWLAVVFDPDLIDRRFLSHSPLLVAVFAAAVCAAVGSYCRLRRPWPYVVLVGVIFSHLLLDFHGVRVGVVEWYSGQTLDDQVPSHAAALPAELCVYGAPLVWTLLVRAALWPSVSQGSRMASWILAVLSTVAALTRLIAVWAPVYTLCVLHAMIVLRRHLNLRRLWNVVPLLPLLALGFTAWLAGHRLHQGILLAGRGLDQEAIRVYQSALHVPARSGRVSIYMWMGMSYEKLGELSAAAEAYEKAVSLSQYPGWPETVLARFYARHEGTPFYRPQQARRLLQSVQETGGGGKDLRAAVSRQWEDLRRRGLAPGIE